MQGLNPYLERTSNNNLNHRQLNPTDNNFDPPPPYTPPNKVTYYGWIWTLNPVTSMYIIGKWNTYIHGLKLLVTRNSRFAL